MSDFFNSLDLLNQVQPDTVAPRHSVKDGRSGDRSSVSDTRKEAAAEEMAVVKLADNHLGTSIHIIRNQKIMLEQEVARLYEVETRTLIRAVRRNIEHFPVDFLFKLTAEEYQQLQDKFPPNGQNHYERNRSTPYAFTEAGVAMISQILNSARALQVNVAIIRDFVRLRRLCGSNLEMADKLDAIDSKYDERFKKLFQALENLQAQLKPAPDKRIGFYVS